LLTTTHYSFIQISFNFCIIAKSKHYRCLTIVSKEEYLKLQRLPWVKTRTTAESTECRFPHCNEETVVGGPVFKQAHTLEATKLSDRLSVNDPIQIDGSRINTQWASTVYHTEIVQQVDEYHFDFDRGIRSSSSCAGASSSDFGGLCKALRRPNTMKRFVRVNKDSAPPCSQSTLDRDVP